MLGVDKSVVIEVTLDYARAGRDGRMAPHHYYSVGTA